MDSCKGFKCLEAGMGEGSGLETSVAGVSGGQEPNEVQYWGILGR